MKEAVVFSLFEPVLIYGLGIVLVPSWYNDFNIGRNIQFIVRELLVPQNLSICGANAFWITT